MHRRLIAVAFVTLAAACKSRSNAPPPTTSSAGASVVTSASNAPSASGALPPLSATSPSIALDNLNAQITSAEQHAWMRGALVELLLARGQYFGHIADYERASTIAEAWVKESPKDAAALLSRASTRSTFHRFADALADLDAAQKNGAKPEEVDPARASIFAATGKLDDAWALTPKGEIEPLLRTMPLAGKALLAGDMGNDAEEARLMKLARDKYVDVSPFPLAWMDAQEAKMLEREGKIAEARAHYRRALDLLPQYATAASHVAALLPPADAVALLEPLTKSSDDPEVEVQLSDALRRAGRADDAAAHLKTAIARYDELLKAHPDAFSDHAAAMWLGPGKDPGKALPLAKANASNRATAEAYDLYLAAALAARDDAEACAAAKGATALKYAPASLKDLAKTAMTRCPSTP